MCEKYYLLTVKCGHIGHHKSIEITRYFKDSSIIEAYFSAKEMPRSQKKSTSVKLVKEISYEEYILGKEQEKLNPYLNTFAC